MIKQQELFLLFSSTHNNKKGYKLIVETLFKNINYIK